MKAKLTQISKTLLVLINEDVKPKIGDWYILDDFVEIVSSDSEFNDSDKPFKIIASSSFKEIPPLSQTLNEIREMIEDKEAHEKAYNYFMSLNLGIAMDENTRGYVNGIIKGIEGYLKANKICYTEEQIIKAIKTAYFTGSEDCLRKRITPSLTLDDILDLQKSKIDCYVEVELAIIGMTDGWVPSYNNPDNSGCDIPAEPIYGYKITKIL